MGTIILLKTDKNTKIHKKTCYKLIRNKEGGEILGLKGYSGDWDKEND